MFVRDTIHLECTTDFEHYQVIDLLYEGRRARVLFSGRRDAAFSGMPLDDNHDLLFDYIQRLYEFTSNLRPKRMLLIGGGTYTLPIALLHTLPDIIIDSVEIDPQLEVIAQEYFNLQHNDRHTLYHTDGKSYLENTSQKYDLIIIDAFSQLEIPDSLADVDFAQLIESHLTSDGLLAMNVISSYRGRRSNAIKRFYRLYKEQLRNVTIFPADPHASDWMSQNYILVGEKDAPVASQHMRYAALMPPDIDKK